MTKTEAKILADLAASRYGRICVSRGYGRGPEGGKISYGDREVKAALKLEAKGLLARVSYDKNSNTWRGNTQYAVDICYVAAKTEG